MNILAQYYNDYTADELQFFATMDFYLILLIWFAIGFATSMVVRRRGLANGPWQWCGWIAGAFFFGIFALLAACIWPAPKDEAVKAYEQAVRERATASTHIDDSMVLEQPPVKYRYECPHCNRTMTSTRNFHKRSVSCPGCQSAFTAMIIDTVKG